MERTLGQHVNKMPNMSNRCRSDLLLTTVVLICVMAAAAVADAATERFPRTHEARRAVSVINTSSHRLVDSIGVGPFPSATLARSRSGLTATALTWLIRAT